LVNVKNKATLHIARKTIWDKKNDYIIRQRERERSKKEREMREAHIIKEKFPLLTYFQGLFFQRQKNKLGLTNH